MITKCSAVWTSPNSPLPKLLKLARQQCPHSHTLDSSELQIGSTHSPTLSPEILNKMIEFLIPVRGLGPELYWAIWILMKIPSIVEKEYILKNMRGSTDFYAMVDKVCNKKATLEDKQAIISHSVCNDCPKQIKSKLAFRCILDCSISCG